jgi:hypothetical protein
MYNHFHLVPGLGEPCESGDSLHAMFYPPTILCDTGLYCDDKNLTCVPIEDTYFGWFLCCCFIHITAATKIPRENQKFCYVLYQICM